MSLYGYVNFVVLLMDVVYFLIQRNTRSRNQREFSTVRITWLKTFNLNHGPVTAGSNFKVTNRKTCIKQGLNI
jgi:hypothetical protein